MEPLETGNAARRGDDGLNAKDNMGRVGPSVTSQVCEPASALRSDPAWGSASGSSAES